MFYNRLRDNTGSREDSLFVRLHTLVQFDDVAADKPDQVAEIRDGRLVSDIVQHVLVVHCGDKGSASGSGLAFAPRPPEKWEHALTHTSALGAQRNYWKGRGVKNETNGIN